MDESNRTNIFENMPVPQAVVRNAVPAMAAMLMVLIYNLADTFFIGQTHDALKVAAVSLATPVFLIFMSTGTVFGIGGTSVISRALGEGRTEYAKKVCSFCMWACVAVGIILSVLFWISMDQILTWVGASEDTWEMTKTYLTIVAFCGPFALLSNCYNNVIRAEGQSMKAMTGQLIGNLLNVILDPILISGLGMGVTGAAIATVIGNVIGGGYYIGYFLRGGFHAQHSYKEFYGEREGVQRRAGDRDPGVPRFADDEYLSDHCKQSDGGLRGYGACRDRCRNEGHNDHRHDLYWIRTGHTAFARLLCGGGALGAVQADHEIFPCRCFTAQRDYDGNLLFV